MKSLVLTALVLSLGSIASAKNMTCSDTQVVPDRSYSVSFSRNLSRAKVTASTFAGPKVIANLECTRTEEQAPNPDGTYVVVTCFEPNMADAGYSLRVTQGGFAGLTQAELFAVSFRGEESVTTFICR